MHCPWRKCFPAVLVAVLIGGCAQSSSETAAPAGVAQPESPVPAAAAATPAAAPEAAPAAETPEPALAAADKAEAAAKSAKDAEDNVIVTSPKGKPPAGFIIPSDAANLSYKVAPVTDGGTLTGKITYDGTPVAPKVFKVEKTPEICGKEDRSLAEVRVNNGALADVVLVLEGVKAGKPFDNFALTGPPPGTRKLEGTGDKFMGTNIRPEKCIFGAYTGVIAAGSILRFDNQDPVKHSPHTYEVRGRVRDSMHNQDLEGFGYLKLGIKFKKDTAKLVKLECDQHEHMQNWFYRVENPYYAFSGADGTFKIDRIPPGKYKLIAWHPVLGEQEQEVTIDANGSGNVTLNFGGRQRRPRS